MFAASNEENKAFKHCLYLAKSQEKNLLLTVTQNFYTVCLRVVPE